MTRHLSCRRAGLAGFTLIELMITLALIAILTMIALPSYSGYVAKARRADARTQLVQAAQFMQRFYAANDTFVADRSGNAVLTQVPANLRQSPADSAKLYDLLIPDATLMQGSFVLQMSPVAAGSMGNDSCGIFTLDSTGVRGVLIGGVVGDTATRDSCWR